MIVSKFYLKRSWHIEIDPEVDFDSRRAVYFRQMRYGLFVRILDIDFRRTRIEHPELIDSHGFARKHHRMTQNFLAVKEVPTNFEVQFFLQTINWSRVYCTTLHTGI